MVTSRYVGCMSPSMVRRDQPHQSTRPRARLRAPFWRCWVLFWVLSLGCEGIIPWQDDGPDGGAETDVDGHASGPWVEILWPTSGEVTNPVTFEFAAGDDVVTVEFTADGWPLQDAPIPADAGSYVYRFEGVGQERHVVLTGYDGDDHAIATDEVWFTPVNSTSELVFPIDMDDSGLFLSNFDSWESTASFGAARSGDRLHAGCDLYWTDDDGNEYVNGYYNYNDNRAVYAIADGTITAYYPFYLGTSAVEVDHGDFVIRYGEVDDAGLAGGLEVGSEVTAGQQIAVMGDLDIGTTWSMLHLELYSGELSGPLTDTGNWSYLNVPNGNYQRRGDLMDCTPFLLDLLQTSGH